VLDVGCPSADAKGRQSARHEEQLSAASYQLSDLSDDSQQIVG
jgi:hypothetical protein